MPNEFNILLGMQLDTSTKTVDEINDQINQLSEKVSKLNIKVTFDSDILKNITQEFKELQKNIDLKFDNLDFTLGLQKASNEIENMAEQYDRLQKSYKIDSEGNSQKYKVVKNITDELDRQVTLTKQLMKNGEIDFDVKVDDNAKKKRDEELKYQQQILDIKRQAIREEEQERISITTNTQKQIDRLITNSNETIAEQQTRMNKVSGQAYEDVWKKAIALKNQEELKYQQEISDIKYQAVKKEEQERLSITTETQKRIERLITNSNETIAEQQIRMNRVSGQTYEDIWKKAIISKSQFEAQESQNLYNTLNNLLTEEYTIKQKLIGADQITTSELIKQLEIIKEQQRQTALTIGKNGLQDEKNISNLLIHRDKLMSELSAKTQKYNNTIIGTFEKLKNVQLEARDVARLLSEQYGGLEIRGYSLDRQTGQFMVKLQQNSKEYLILKGNIDQVTGALQMQSQTVEEVKNRNLGFFEQLKIAFERVPIWLGATTIYFQGFNFIRQMVTDISSINAAMIDLAKVSNATEKELDRFSKLSPSMASDLGVLNSELQSVTNEVVRLGYSLEDAEKLSEVALIMKNIGDLDNVGQAMDYMISIMKSYNVEVDDTAKIMDFLNYTADTTSVSFQDLGNGITRVASSMSAANNSLEETMAMLVASVDLTRNAEKSSTALRTISMNLRGVNEEGEEIVGYIPKLEDHFKKLGLTLKKDDQTFKSTYQIFKELSEVWQNLSDMEQAQTLELVAGKRQADVAAGLINNFKEAEEVVNNATNAVGSATKEQERYMQGVESAQKRLMNSLTELNQKLLESDTIIGALNFADSFVQNASATGKWNIVVLLLVGALGLLATAQRKSIINSVQLEAVTLASGTGFKKLTADIGTATLALLGIKPVADGAKISILALNVAMSAILLGLPLLIQGIGALIRSEQEAKASAYEMVQSFGQVVQKHNDTIKTLFSLKDEYDSLNKKLGENRDFTKLTADEQNRYNEIAKQLDQITPGFISAYDSKGNAIVNYKKKVDDLIESEREQLELERLRLLSKGSKIIEETQDDISEKERKKLKKRATLIAYEDALEKNQTLLDSGKYAVGTSGYETLSKEINKTKNLIVQTKSELKLLNAEIDGNVEKQRAVVNANLYTIDNMTNIDDGLKQIIKNYVMAEFSANGAKEAIAKSFSFEEIVNDLDKMYEAFNKGNINMGKSLEENISKKLKQDLKLSEEEIDEFINKYIEYINEMNRIPDDLNKTEVTQLTTQQLVEKQQELYDAFEKSTSKMREYIQYLAELNSEEGLSGKSKQEIIENYPQLLAYLDDDKRLTEKLMELKSSESKVQKQAYLNMLMYNGEFFDEKIRGNKELITKLVGFYKSDFDNYKTLIQLKWEAENALLDGLSEQWLKYFNILSNGQNQVLEDGLVKAAIMGNTQAQQVLQAVQERRKISERFDKIAFDLGGIDFDSINNQDAQKKDKKNALDKIFYKLPKYNAQIKDITKSLEKMNSELSKMENNISVAQSKLELSLIGKEESIKTSSQILKLQTSLLAKRKEERNVLHQTANQLREVQSQINKEFKLKFKLDVSNITEQQIKSFHDNIDVQVINLQNKLNKATTDASRNALQKQIDNLSNSKTLFNELIQASTNSQNEIKNLSSEWWKSWFDSIDIEKELKQRVVDLQEELNQINFDKFELSIQKAKSAITPFNNQIDLLNTKLEMLFSNDYDGKIEVIAEQMETAKNKGNVLRSMFDNLSSIIPTTVEEADKLVGELSDLQNGISENTLSLINYQKEIDNLRLEKLTSEFKETNDELARELKFIDNNLSLLKDGFTTASDFDLNFGFDISLPMIPKSLIEKKRQETEKLVKEETNRHKKIQDIQQISYDLQNKKLNEHDKNVRAEIALHYTNLSANIVKELKLQQSEYESHQSAITQIIKNMLTDVETNHKMSFNTVLTDIKKFVSDALSEYEKLNGFVPVVIENKSAKPTANKNVVNSTDNKQPNNIINSNQRRNDAMLNDAWSVTLKQLIEESKSDPTNKNSTPTVVIEQKQNTDNKNTSSPELPSQIKSDINRQFGMSPAVMNIFKQYQFDREKAMAIIKKDQEQIIKDIANGIDVTGLRDAVLAKIDEQTQKDVKMQFDIKDDLLRQQNESASKVLQELEEDYKKAIDPETGDADLAQKIAQEYYDALDIYYESNEKLKQSIKERYDYEFALIDRNLSKQEKNTKTIQQNLKQIELTSKNNYDDRIKLTNDLISSEETYANSISNAVALLEKERDTKPAGGYEWNVINQEVERLKQLLIDTNGNIIQMKQNVAEIEFESLTNGLQNFDKEISNLEYALRLKQSLHPNDIIDVQDMQEINSLYQQIADANQRQVIYLYEVLDQLREKQRLLQVNSNEWMVIQGQIDGVISRIRTANLEIAQQSKESFRGFMNEYIPQPPQENSFNPFSQSTNDTNENLIDGLEKELEVKKIMLFVQQNELKLTKEQLKVLNSEGAIRKENLEIIQKQLELQQLERKLANLKEQKTIQTLKQKEDGTWDFEYVVDQEAINEVENAILDKKLDIEKSQKAIAQQQANEVKQYWQDTYDANNRAAKEHYDEQKKLLEDILDKAENRMYKTADEFKKALKSVDLDLPIDDMVAKYETYLLQGITLSINEAVDIAKSILLDRSNEFEQAGNISGKKYIDGLSDKINEIMSGEGDIQTKQQMIVDMLAEESANFAIAGNESGMEFIDGLLKSMSTDNYTFDLNNISNAIINQLIVQSDNLKLNGQNLGSSLIDGILIGIDNVMNDGSIENKTQAILELLNSVNEYGTLGETLGNSFIDGLINTVSATSDEVEGEGNNTLSNALNKMLTQLDEKMIEFEDKGDAQGVAYVEALKIQLESLLEDTEVTQEDIINLLNNSKEYEILGTQSGQFYKNGLTNQLRDGKSKALAGINDILNTIKIKTNSFSDLGTEQATAYVQSLLDTFKNIVIDNIEAEGLDFERVGAQHGQQYVQSVVDALKSLGGQISDTVTGIARQLQAGASYTVQMTAVITSTQKSESGTNPPQSVPQSKSKSNSLSSDLILLSDKIDMSKLTNSDILNTIKNNIQNPVLSSTNGNSFNTINNNQTKQKTEVNINAHFPNVTSSFEIKNALDTLILTNGAKQYNPD